MKRLAAVATVLLLGCMSPLERAMRESNTGSGAAVSAQADLMRMTMAMQAAQRVAEARCQPLATREVPWAEERLYGATLALRQVKQHPVYGEGKDPLTRRVAEVGKLLASRSARPDLPWVFGVLESDTPDALAAPGGYVFVTTALLAKMTNEAELGGVLGHEIAHVALKHPLVAWQEALARQCAAATTVAEAARNGIEPSESQRQFIAYAEKLGNGAPRLDEADGGLWTFVFDVALLAGSTDAAAELEADRVGAELSAFAGYDGSQYHAFLQRLEAEPLPTGKDGKPSRAGYLAFKPPTAERVAKLKAYLDDHLAAFAHGKAKPDLTPLLAPLKK